ncbi:MAG TPA: HAD family hydrolase [Candidatus Tumulicola sp.]
MNVRPVVGVGFDIDHTLVIDNKLERIAMLQMLETIQDRGGSCGNLVEESRLIDELLARQRAGEFTIDEAVFAFVRERGIEPDVQYAERFRTIALDMVDRVVIPLPGAREMLQNLQQRGIRTAVLSNGWNPLQILKARRAGFEGAVIASADIGIQKPDARAFDALLGALGTARENTWYVGDSATVDVQGAVAAGLRSVWIDADELSYPAGVTEPEYRIEYLADLPALLEARSHAIP